MTTERPCPRCGGEIRAADLGERCSRCSWSRERRGRIWYDAQAGEPEGFDRDALARLEGMDGHIWTEGRRKLTRILFRRLAAGVDGRGLELGCGTGNSLPLLEERFREVDAVDLYPRLLEAAAEKSAKANLFQADVRSTGLPSGKYDFILSQDVLEHVNPDAMLSEARRLAKTGAILFLTVPASPALWSPMDEKAGHRCRYTRRLLEDEAIRNGWKPAGRTHFLFLAYPALWLSRKWIPGGGNDRERSPNIFARIAGSALISPEVALLNRFSLPWGSSLFFWAEAA